MQARFTILRAALEAGDRDALLSDILAATGSEAEAISILRSVERYGLDASIDYFEITEVAGRRMPAADRARAWRVRADRGEPEAETEIVAG
jgi:hypothetical protein